MRTHPRQDEASSEPLRGCRKGPAEHITPLRGVNDGLHVHTPSGLVPSHAQMPPSKSGLWHEKGRHSPHRDQAASDST